MQYLIGKKATAPFTVKKFQKLAEELAEYKKLLSRPTLNQHVSLMMAVMEWTTVPNNQHALDKILKFGKLLSKYTTKVPTLYRGIRVNATRLNEIKDKGITFDKPTSWTLNEKKARIYATGQAGTDLKTYKEKTYGIILRLTNAKVILNIHDFISKNQDLVRLADLGALPGGNDFTYEPGTLVEEESIVGKIHISPNSIHKIIPLKD